MNQDTIPVDSLTSPDKAELNRVRDQERSRSVREVDARVRSRKTKEGGGACASSRGAECTDSIEPASRRWEQELCVTRGHELTTEVLVACRHSYRVRALSISGRRTRRWTPEPVRYRRGSVPPRRRPRTWWIGRRSFVASEIHGSRGADWDQIATPRD